MKDREKWARIAAAHLQSIQDLQRRIAGFDGTLGQDDVMSLAGFSDVSDLEDCANALDVFIGVGEVDLSAAQRLHEDLNRGEPPSAPPEPPTGSAPGAPSPPAPPAPVPPVPPAPSVPPAPGAPQIAPLPEELRTLVCIEFVGFDMGFSAVASGLQPIYDSLVTFGPFNVNDDILEQLAEGMLRVEVHGSLPGSEGQRILGRGQLPMSGLLQYGTQDTRNPVAGGVVAIKDPKDQDILIAKLRLKLRLRYSIEELAEDFKMRAKVRQMDRGRKCDRPCYPSLTCHSLHS